MRFPAAIRVPSNPFRVPVPLRPAELQDGTESVTFQAVVASSELPELPSQPADLDQRVRQSGEW